MFLLQFLPALPTPTRVLVTCTHARVLAAHALRLMPRGKWRETELKINFSNKWNIFSWLLSSRTERCDLNWSLAWFPNSDIFVEWLKTLKQFLLTFILQEICREWEGKPPDQKEFDPFFKAVSAVANSSSNKLKNKVKLITGVSYLASGCCQLLLSFIDEMVRTLECACLWNNSHRISRYDGFASFYLFFSKYWFC